MIDWESFYGAFRTPDFVPGYEIQNHLGGGAFGEVYKARKTSIGKSYAIKFLRIDDAAQQDAVERELEQVRLFAAIDHPNLVTIEDMGVVRGVPYLIMGYAGEDTLARRLKRGELDRESALRTFVQVARGVLALHDRRLAHFDLKPSNVFLNGDVARVGDYGLAKLLTEGRVTLSFGRGTPHYMAPEMLKNRADHRADIYSLGVILYESLCFQLPFEPDSGGTFLVREDDRPPGFPAAFPPALRPVVERCLRLDPAQRFASVNELLDAMGQTARQGDSVRFESLASNGAPLPVPLPRAGTASGDTPRAASGDLRSAASELARGAVEIARGVWGGVTSVGARGESAPGAADAAGASPPDADESEVLVIHSLEDPDEASLASGAPARSGSPFASADAPWRVELRRARESTGPDRGLVTAAGSASAALATVPVPPRAEGGLVGSVVQSLVVGAEIMGALVTGPLLVGVRGTARTLDRVVRGLPGLVGALVRLLLFLVLMGILGGVCAFVVLAAIALNA
jgi:tRNA A-37 threonylcarbamoyl transferase component Bud32